MRHNAQHRTPRAMCLQSTFAEFAYWPQSICRARDIDFARHALTHPPLFCRRRNSTDLHNLANKFMPRRAAKPMVAAQDLRVGIAYPGKPHANERPSWTQLGRGLANLGQLLVSNHKADHLHFTVRICPESLDELAPPRRAFLR